MVKKVLDSGYSNWDPSVVEKLQEFGIEVVEDELMIQRGVAKWEIRALPAYINGQLATVALLKQIGPYLIDIHGQNEHFLL